MLTRSKEQEELLHQEQQEIEEYLEQIQYFQQLHQQEVVVEELMEVQVQ
jgi:hypothetical protein